MMKDVYYDKHVFISYSHRDKNFVERLINDLESQGVNVWYDEKEIMVGDSISQKIEDEISRTDFFCLVISKNSVQSDWVKYEYRFALNKQLSQEKKPKILPLLIDDTPKNMFLSDIKYADFSKGYNNGLQPLLDAIKVNSVIPKEEVFKKNSKDDDSLFNCYDILGVLKDVDEMMKPVSDSIIFFLLKESHQVDILFRAEQFLEMFMSKVGTNPSDFNINSITMWILLRVKDVFKDIRVACSTKSPFKRSKLAKNVKAILNQIREKGEEICLNPEWPIIKIIILNWMDILDKSGWEFPEDELHQPLENPYEGSSGLPIYSAIFKGREDILKKIETYWTTDKNFSTLFLHGQRCIGKTSILLNMTQRIESNIILVYINMEKVGKINHTGQLLCRIAESIHNVVEKNKVHIINPPYNEDFLDMGTGYASFNRIMDKLAPYMNDKKHLILAIDEFELIERKINEKQIDIEFLSYLRSLIKEYKWLGIIFSGQHTIKEMSPDYRWAFYGPIEYIPVSFLSKEDSFKLISYPHTGFKLEYSPDLMEELYRLTSGQPYLIQRVCWELVTRWNERFFQDGVNTSRELTLADLQPVITKDFFESASYYFDGVWDSVTENERILMRIIAQREEDTRTLDELAEIAKTCPPLDQFSNLKEAIDLLKRHDVILEEEGNVRFASELMRRWVAVEKRR
ncbi:MAG: toll/interleukin-1 receptor domain-containing protein [Acidobacteria bacterium]|jgi:hypothetical protein|nr:toll/interleukin-1 receptor domain-containing protein [Acidobacteriota bacterium]